MWVIMLTRSYKSGICTLFRWDASTHAEQVPQRPCVGPADDSCFSSTVGESPEKWYHNSQRHVLLSRKIVELSTSESWSSILPPSSSREREVRASGDNSTPNCRWSPKRVQNNCVPLSTHHNFSKSLSLQPKYRYYTHNKHNISIQQARWPSSSDRQSVNKKSMALNTLLAQLCLCHISAFKN